MKICPNCHTSYDDSVKFCPECGAELVEEEKPKVVEAVPVDTPEEENRAENARNAAGGAGEQTRREENSWRQSWQGGFQTARQAPHSSSFSDRFLENVPNADNWKQLYFSFRGRISRGTFIFRWLVIILTGAVVSGITTFLPVIGPVSGLALFALFLSYLTLAVRRLHDSGHSGLWTVLVFVPLLAFVLLLYLLFSRGQRTVNEYGDWVE